MIPDLSASADVVLGAAENKTLIPLSAVQAENGKTYVSVKKDGSSKRERFSSA